MKIYEIIIFGLWGIWRSHLPPVQSGRTGLSEEGVFPLRKINSESEQNTLVDFLHDLGVILHFKDIPLLNTHVLEPEWVTNAVYKLVNSKELAESRGVLKLDMFAEILKQRTERDFPYPPDQYGFFIS